MTLEVVPVNLTQVRRFVGEHHRHNLPPEGWLWGCALMAPDRCALDERSHRNALRVKVDGAPALVVGELVGVGIVSTPKARKLMQADPFLVEVARTCVLEDQPNACSRLLGALCRAAKALGYRRAVTYTLACESGASLKAAGFVVDELLPPSRGWDQPSRARYETDLFGEARTPEGPKIRWRKEL